MHPCIADPSSPRRRPAPALQSATPRLDASRLGALLLPALLLVATGASGKASDRNQATNIDASATDCSVSNETAPCVFTGNVVINQGTLEIRADRADVRRANGEMQSVKLNGAPVRLKQQGEDGGWMNATARQVDYDLAKTTVVLTGGASIQQPGRGSIQGERIVYNTATGQVQSGGAGGGGGRVKMSFEPRSPGPATTPSAPRPVKPAPAQPAQNAPAPAPAPKGTP